MDVNWRPRYVSAVVHGIVIHSSWIGAGYVGRRLVKTMALVLAIFDIESPATKVDEDATQCSG